ncbi:MAG: winged helix-turn-helix domain-containing protein, partial [Candidatus Thorarchaeota archaeon]
MVLSQEDSVIPGDDSSDWESLPTADAKALLRSIREIEEGSEIDVFQPGPEIERLMRMMGSYRGSLFTALRRRIGEVRRLGGVEVITQKDLWLIVEELWSANVSLFSDTELAVLKCSLDEPGLNLRSLAQKSGLSYSQARRAVQRLRRADVLRIEGLLNAGKLGLQRVLVLLESPTLVLSSVYITKTLFIDGAEPRVLHVATIPNDRIEDMLNIVRGLRTTSTRASVWKISAGKPAFDGRYSSKTGWNLDVFHWSTQVRKGENHLVLGESSPSTPELVHFTATDLKIADQLNINFEATAQEIVESTGLSESTVFRKRAQLIEKRVVVPRSRARVPQLTDRVLVLSDASTAGSILAAWSLLPITYMTRLENLETSETRVLQIAALPPGTSRSFIRALESWMSRVDDYSANVVHAGTESCFKAAAMFNRR